ncbi:MAG TPA: cytosine permease [Candidatus Obscuribacterales bacterium]
MTSVINKRSRSVSVEHHESDDAVDANSVAFDEHAHPFTPVPAHERRGPLTMGLLWITMVTSFPTVLIGFEWFKAGLSLSQVVVCTLISSALLLAYAIPASQLGAVSGLGYGTLSRSVFGRWGSRLVSFNLVWIFIAWYGLCALFMAEGLEGLFNLKLPMMALSVTFAVLMAFNNFFGFKGVANFARYFAAPILIVWVAYTFVKASMGCPSTALTEVSHVSFTSALMTVSAFVIGFGAWGNESDYWRFGKPKTKYTAIPLAVALCIGQVIFPITGFMVARMTGITEYGAAISFMNNYSFGGLAVLGAIVLAASYFAANDSNLFGSVHACENLKQWSHRGWVAVLAILGACMAAWLSISGTAKSLEAIASLNCIVLPTPTVIMIAEWLLIGRILRRDCDWFSRVPELDELPPVRFAACSALVAGIGIGILTAGILPGCQSLHVGICSLQAWLTAALVYVPLRVLEHRRELEQRRLALESLVAVPVAND